MRYLICLLLCLPRADGSTCLSELLIGRDDTGAITLALETIRSDLSLRPLSHTEITLESAWIALREIAHQSCAWRAPREPERRSEDNLETVTDLQDKLNQLSRSGKFSVRERVLILYRVLEGVGRIETWGSDERGRLLSILDWVRSGYAGIARLDPATAVGFSVLYGRTDFRKRAVRRPSPFERVQTFFAPLTPPR